MDNYSKAEHNQIVSELKHLLGEWCYREKTIRVHRGWKALEDEELPHSLNNPLWSYAEVVLTMSETISTTILIKTRLGCPRYIELGESGNYAPISRETLFEALLIHHGILS